MLDGGTALVASCSGVQPLALQREGGAVALEVLHQALPLAAGRLLVLEAGVLPHGQPHAVEVHGFQPSVPRSQGPIAAGRPLLGLSQRR